MYTRMEFRNFNFHDVNVETVISHLLLNIYGVIRVNFKLRVSNSIVIIATS